MSPDELLEGLTEPQRRAVTHGNGPLLVLAGPGSGKTRVITHRAAYLAQTATDAYHLLAITFTNKAANEMASRLDRLGVGAGMTCSTFHSLCARLLRMYHDRAGLQPNFTIFDTADQTAAMKDAIGRANLSTDHYPAAGILSIISRAKNDMVTADEMRVNARGFRDEVFADLYVGYDQILAEQNALDFDDLLIRAARLLSEHPDLRDQLEDRYRYVLVDEYQDTNRAQYLIARGLALKGANLCVTGDPDQSIYSWRGADIHNILQFEGDFPNATVVRLEQNYRSTPRILAAADALIANNHKRKEKALWTENADGPAVRVGECEDQHAEAGFIAREIRRHVEEGGRFGDVAIFYRINALSRNLEMALRGAQIPYQIARGVAFYQRREIKDVLAYLRVAANPRDQVSLLRIINVPTRGIGKTTVDHLVAAATRTGQTVLEVLAKPDQVPGVSRAERHLKSFAVLMSDLATTVRHGLLKDAVEFVVRNSGLIAMWDKGEDNDALANVEELINAAAEYDQQHLDGSGSLTDWLQGISLVSDVDAIDEESGAVTMMTLHAAKGLEFDTVFLTGLEQGLLPHERSAMDLFELEEERRLCFVGMTRARRRLTLTHARWRDFRGMSERRAKSQFLHELPKRGIEKLRIDISGAGAGEDEEPDMPASSVDYLAWRKGQLVRSARYGIGRLLWIQPRNRQTYAGVKFTSFGEKTLVLEYANLELVEEEAD